MVKKLQQSLIVEARRPVARPRPVTTLVKLEGQFALKKITSVR